VPTADQIKEQAEAIFNTVREIRRHIHANPELSFNETETSKYICEQLEKLGLEYKSGYVKTGIVALIKGKNPGKKVLMLRADIDALPITEQNKTEYVSKNKGIMHACGHDVHSSCAIGAAYILNKFKSDFEGTVKIIFQPGEEVLPGGASLMIKEGVLKDPEVNVAIAQHVHPSMEVGKVGFRSGMYMASTDEIYLTITGKGGHAAMPADYNNPLLVAAEVLLELKKKFPNDGKNEIPTVLAFGKIEGAGATNVIPQEVKMAGTFRTMDEKWRSEAHDTITKTVMEVCVKNNAKADINILRGYPFLVNDKAITESSRKAAMHYLGKDNVEELPLRMTAEDFAYFTQELPCCFYRLGTGNKAKGIVSGVHTPTFDIDEEALKIGSGLMAWLALEQLRSI
jgi:amidohydrolase